MAQADIGLLAVLSENLVSLRWLGDTRSDPDGVWVRSKLRKEATCPVSGVSLAPGDWAFRPVGNQDYRMRRIAPIVVEALVADAQERGLLDD